MTSREIRPEWIEASRQGFVDAWRLMARHQPGGAVDEYDGLALAATGVRLAGTNTVMAVDVPRSPAGALAHARDFFERRGLPWVVYASHDAARVIAPHTQTAGLRESFPEPAMFLLPEDVQRPVPPPGFTVEVVRDAQSMARYRQTASAGFELDEVGFMIWANPDLIDTPGLVFYLGLLDGVPVATSCVYALHGIATVNMVSTVPVYRKRGLGELMTWRAVEDGLTMGCEVAFLHASRMGYTLYERMGFRHTFTYQTWIG